MNHRPFEEWLLVEEPLSSQQKHELSKHLKDCQTCSALAEVNIALRSVRQAEPTDGFVSRFQLRLKTQKRVLRRRNTLGFGLLTMCVAGTIIGLAWPVLVGFFNSPVEMLSSGLTSLVGIWAAIQALFHAGSLLFKVAPGFVPNYVWGIVLFLFSGMSILWIVSLLKFVRGRMPSISS